MFPASHPQNMVEVYITILLLFFIFQAIASAPVRILWAIAFLLHLTNPVFGCTQHIWTSLLQCCSSMVAKQLACLPVISFTWVWIPSSLHEVETMLSYGLFHVCYHHVQSIHLFVTLHTGLEWITHANHVYTSYSVHARLCNLCSMLQIV